MFFRKKKYDIVVDRDLPQTNRNDFTNRNTSDFSFTSDGGETLSRKKEQRRISAMNQRLSTSSFSTNGYSHAPPTERESNSSETKPKPSIGPTFEQGMQVPKTSGRTDLMPTNSIGQNSKKEPPLRIQTIPTTAKTTTTTTTTGNKSKFTERLEFPSEVFHDPPPPGPTNIDDVINSDLVLNSTSSRITTSSSSFGASNPTSAPLSTSLSTKTSTDIPAAVPSDNSNNNNNNSDDDDDRDKVLEKESPPHVKPLNDFPNDFPQGITSLRQLRKAAQKTSTTASTKSLPIASNFIPASRSPPRPSLPTTVEPPPDPSKAEGEGRNSVTSEEELRTATESSMSSSSSTHHPPTTLPSPTEENTKLSKTPSSSILLPTAVLTPIIRNPTTTATTTTTFKTTNIDDECSKDLVNKTPNTTPQQTNTAISNNNNNIEATKIYIGSGFIAQASSSSHHHPPPPSETSMSISTDHGNDSNDSKPPVHPPQSNCISRIIIKNDTIAITSGDDSISKFVSIGELSPSGLGVCGTIPAEGLVLKKSELMESRSVVASADGRVENEFTGKDENENDVEEKEMGCNEDVCGTDECDKVRGDDDDDVEASCQLEQSLARVPDGQETNDVDPDDDEDDDDDHRQPQRQEIPLREVKQSPSPTTTTTTTTTTTAGKFKLNAGSAIGKAEEEDDEDGVEKTEEHEYFRRRKKESIEGRNGSFRGVKNLVRSGISAFAHSQEHRIMKNLTDQSKGKITFFTTSMSVIRSTRDRCSDVKKVLQNQRIYFEERDVYISDENAKDLMQRFRLERQRSHTADVGRTKDQSQDRADVVQGDYSKTEQEEMLAKLPRVFVEDFDLGNYEEIMKLNETGVLKKIFEEFPKVQGDATCPGCGGYRYTPCYSCHGSKKSRSNAFTEEFFALRCTKCDENGLARCNVCNTTDLTSDE